MFLAFSSPLLALAYPIIAWFVVVPIAVAFLLIGYLAELKHTAGARRMLAYIVGGNSIIIALLVFFDDFLLWWAIVGAPAQLIVLLRLADRRKPGSHRLNLLLQVLLGAIIAVALFIGGWELFASS